MASQGNVNTPRKYVKNYWAQHLFQTDDFSSVIEQEPFIVFNLRQHRTSDGTPYLRLELGDRTGRIPARIWQEDFERCNITELKEGDIVVIGGLLTEFNGKRYIRITELKRVTEFEVELTQLVANLLQEDVEKLYKELLDIIGTIQDPHIKKLLENIFKDPIISEAFKRSAAGETVHHDYPGGLLEHTLEMVHMAEAILPHYPEANRDIVIAGILLHDIGKIIEYETLRTNIRRTKKGHLLGHINLGIEIVNRFLSEDFPEEYKLHLFHIILSHHGELEYGSPLRPATIEAIIVSVVDGASSKVKQYQKELRTKKPDEYGFGEYHKYIRTRVYFSPWITQNEEEV